MSPGAATLDFTSSALTTQTLKFLLGLQPSRKSDPQALQRLRVPLCIPLAAYTFMRSFGFAEPGTSYKLRVKAGLVSLSKQDLRVRTARKTSAAFAQIAGGPAYLHRYSTGPTRCRDTSVTERSLRFKYMDNTKATNNYLSHPCFTCRNVLIMLPTRHISNLEVRVHSSFMHV